MDVQWSPNDFTTITEISGRVVMIKTADIRNITYAGGGYRVIYDTPDSPLRYDVVLIDEQEFNRLEEALQTRLLLMRS